MTAQLHQQSSAFTERPSGSLDMVAALEKQVALTPDATAIVCGRSALTYGQFNARVNALSLRLRQAGYGPGVYLGIAFERSPELLVALWAVVKAGAAYIPVDPGYPEDRIAHMAASARWAALLTTPSLAVRFAATAGAGPIIEVEGGEVASVPDPVCPAGPQDPLYAIFTSGSTGQPKAASVFRGGFANLLTWYARAFELASDCRVLVLTSPSFDLTQKNLFAPLLAGGTVILQPHGPYDLAAIEHEVTTRGVTLINTTPSAFYPLVDAAASRGYAPLTTLRAAVLGGEPISIPRLRAWLESPATRAYVANTYGPTECTDICAWHRMDRGNLDAWPFVPLGRELPGVGIVLLDGDLKPVPDGEQGELCITGVGVGGGYLRQPALTAERFIANPCRDRVPGPTLYRTGDLARRGPDGVLEFRGRMDHQVKVRGFRVELGEIEHVLAEHPAVREAVVTATGRGDERTGLVAWLLPRGAPVEATELKAHVSARLPAHMVPDRVRWLEAYPLTPNRKVDRRNLEAREAGGPAVPAPAPRSGEEQRLLSLWSEILGHEVTDPTASFFDLGGNSLQLAVLHARLCEAGGHPFPITDLFSHPTVRSLSAFLAGPAPGSGREDIRDRARRQQDRFAQLRRPTRP